MISTPTADFVTSSLSGAITFSATSATIGTGLNLPSTNGILQIDYDSSSAVGSSSGPETIQYSSYNSVTGALSGITRGLAGTTGVSHNNGAPVQLGSSVLYLTPTWTNWTPILYKSDGVTALSGAILGARYTQVGKIVTATISANSLGNPSGPHIFISLPVTKNNNGFYEFLGSGSALSGTYMVFFQYANDLSKAYLSLSNSNNWNSSNNDFIIIFTYESI